MSDNRSIGANQGHDLVDTLLFGFAIAGLAWVPLWYGSNRIFPWAVNAILFGSLAIAYELNVLMRDRRHPFGFKEIRAPALMYAGVVLWIFLQRSTLVPISWQHPVYAMASRVLNKPVAGSISVNRDLTTLALMRLLTDGSAFWVFLQLSRDSRRAHLLLQAIGVIAAAYAVYGFVDMAFGGTMSGFYPSDRGFYVRATFIDKNSFATYAGLGLLCNLGLLFRAYRRASPAGSSLRIRVATFLQSANSQVFSMLAAGCILLSALLLTGSRGGIVVGIFGTVALTLMTFGRGRQRGREQIELVLFIAVVVAGAFYLFGDMFAGRIASSGLVDESRMAVYWITIQSIVSNLVAGFGYGTFGDVFPMYRDESIWVGEVWDKAHNTYLEIFQGLGIIGGAVLLTAVLILVVYCIRGVLQRRQSSTPSSVGFAAALLVGTHALVDFSLQIQAVTLTFLALLAAGVSQSISSRRGTAD